MFLSLSKLKKRSRSQDECLKHLRRLLLEAKISTFVCVQSEALQFSYPDLYMTRVAHNMAQ